MADRWLTWFGAGFEFSHINSWGMDFNSIRSFFMRFSKDKLSSLCKEYGVGGNLKKPGSTKDYLCRILAGEAISGKITVKDIERFDLQHYQSCSNKKLTVYKMEGKVSNKQFCLNDPEHFQELLEQELKSYLNCKVGTLPQDNTLWLRISIFLGDMNLLLSPKNTVYMIYVPGSSYILLSSVKVTFKSYLIKAIENLFGCDGISEIDLTGKKVGSLHNLVLNKSSQGSFSDFRLNQVDDNPLSRKRKRETADDSHIDKNSKIFNEQQSKDRKSKLQTLKAFGSNPQPLLEKVEFKMESRFRGTDHIPALTNTTINCFVKFKGSNVLEGIRNLSEHGLVSQPLPSHLTKIHSFSRNHFILTDKKRTKSV